MREARHNSQSARAAKPERTSVWLLERADVNERTERADSGACNRPDICSPDKDRGHQNGGTGGVGGLRTVYGNKRGQGQDRPADLQEDMGTPKVPKGKGRSVWRLRVMRN